MIVTTLCYLLKDDYICLADKKRGFGRGKLNGIGGKVRDDEVVEKAAVREMKEEIGVLAKPDHLENVGSVRFFFPGRPEWDNYMHIYLVRQWKGEPKESDEMKPQWHRTHKLPYDKMWLSDPHWLPRILDGKKISAEFHFLEDGNKIGKFEVESY